MNKEAINNVKSWYRESPSSAIIDDMKSLGKLPVGVDNDLETLLKESMIQRGLMTKCYQVNIKDQVVAQFFNKREFNDYVISLGENAHIRTITFHMTEVTELKYTIDKVGVPFEDRKNEQ